MYSQSAEDCIGWKRQAFRKRKLYVNFACRCAPGGSGQQTPGRSGQLRESAESSAKRADRLGLQLVGESGQSSGTEAGWGLSGTTTWTETGWGVFGTTPGTETGLGAFGTTTGTGTGCRRRWWWRWLWWRRLFFEVRAGTGVGPHPVWPGPFNS